MNDERAGRRCGGRADRLAKRARPPGVNPCPPGQRGRQYRPLSDSDRAAIHATALRLPSGLDGGEMNEVPSPLRDLCDVIRLQDALTAVSWFTLCCIATDLPDIDDLHESTVFALLKGTAAPVATAFTGDDPVAPILRMVDFGPGGDRAADLLRAPAFLKGHISPMISPMRYGEDAVVVTHACIKHGIPVSCIIAAQSRATSPATLAGFLAQSLAETRASLMKVTGTKPGHRMVFMNWPLVVGLRTGSFVGGGGAISGMNAALALIFNWLGLPSGGNLTADHPRTMASLPGARSEAVILNDKMQFLVCRTPQGAEVNDEALGYEAIRKADLGPSRFLGGAHTIAAMQRDHVFPTFADRDARVIRDEKGRPDAWGRAKLAARRALEMHHPAYLSPSAEARMQGKFPIWLEAP
ncbi:MAG: trimethylamine methyltransferase [Rhodobacteraceae bacterium]|nr:trimethylamine methyltransferase [Paracoccaceae bacterium]